MKALSRDLNERYASPAKLAEDIDCYLKLRPVVARSGNSGYRAMKFARRNRKFLAAAVIVFSLGTVSINLAMENRRLLTLHQELRQMPARLASSLGLDNGTTESLAGLSADQLKQIPVFAEQFHDNFVEAIRISPGMTAERLKILDGAIQVIDRSREIAGPDLDKQFWVANAYYAVANLQGYPNETNLGDYSGALTSYEQARSLLTNILSLQPLDGRATDLLRKVESRVVVVRKKTAEILY
jgi:serine/threonine-protein kinase